MARAICTAEWREAVTTMALARPPSRPRVWRTKCSTITWACWDTVCSCMSANRASRLFAFEGSTSFSSRLRFASFQYVLYVT
ncbi:hypothetical protein SAURM35S_07663 [Streptomyces aurantiogriseus]